MVSEETIIAQVGFPIYKSDEDLARERAEAVAGVAPIFVYDPDAVETMLQRVRTFMVRVDSAATVGDPAKVHAELSTLLQTYGLVTGGETIDLLRDSERRLQLLRALETAIRSELPVGIASVGEVEGSGATPLRRRSGGEQKRLTRREPSSAQADTGW